MQQRARVEGPDHVQQFSQLSAVIAPWYHSAHAEAPEDVGTYTDEFPLSDDDFHVRARSKPPAWLWAYSVATCG